MAERIRFRGDPGGQHSSFGDALDALVGPVRNERVAKRDRGYRNAPRRVPARMLASPSGPGWSVRVNDKTGAITDRQAPRGYTVNGRGDLLSHTRALRRQLELAHGKLSGRQWVRLRRERP